MFSCVVTGKELNLIWKKHEESQKDIMFSDNGYISYLRRLFKASPH